MLVLSDKDRELLALPYTPKINRSGHLIQSLLLYQILWMLDDSDFKIWEKSRRIGATYCHALKMVMKAARKDGCDQWIFSTNEDAAKEVLRDCAKWVVKLKEAGMRIDCEVRREKIHFKNGFRINALPTKPQALRGKQGDVLIDEAAYVNNLEDFLDAFYALSIHGGKLSVISTHNGSKNSFNKLIEASRANTYNVHSTTITEAVESGLLEMIGKGHLDPVNWENALAETYGAAAGQELYCTPRQGNSSLFPALSSIRLIKVKEFDVPEIRHGIKCDYIGVDFGRTIDATSIVGYSKEGEPLIIYNLKNTFFNVQLSVILSLCHGGTKVVVDKGSFGLKLFEDLEEKLGTRVTGVNISTKWKNIELYGLSREMTEGMLIPNYKDLATDLECFNVTETGSIHIGRIDGRHGDGVMAIAMIGRIMKHSKIANLPDFTKLNHVLNPSSKHYAGY
jgi:phage FluMu gp28-like protein